MRPDGSAVRNITNTPEFEEAAPRFSPDGRRLLYRRLERGAKIDHDRYGFQGQLMIARADGTEAQPLGKNEEYPWGIWSPDGTQIAYMDPNPKGIHILDLDTQKVVKDLARHGMYQQLIWSLDGKWFGGVANHLGASWTVARINAATQEINPVNEFQNCTPDWFPDSRRMIFSHRPGNQGGYGWTQLWMADGDGTNRQLVYGRDGRHIYGGVLSPDMKYVMFTSCGQDGGGSEKKGAPICVMRMSDAPTIEGESKALRKLHPNTKDGPVLTLHAGWEPHWTFASLERGTETK
jgi:Tol biopolymer transport system component